VGLKPILRTTTSFSASKLLVGSFDPQKPVPDMTYNVFSGTLNHTQSTMVPCQNKIILKISVFYSNTKPPVK